VHIFPALDLIGGSVVRLYQGDYEKKEVFGNDPLTFAARFAALGAGFLHLVDLDGAKSGEPKHLGILRSIKQSFPGLYVEFGGGVRGDGALERCLEAGADCVILGTAALKDRPFTTRALGRYGERIAVGVDARNGKAAAEGWTEDTDLDAVQLCRELYALGAGRIIYTDIAKDGAGRGTNLEVYKVLSEIQGLKVTASGGIGSYGEIRTLREMGLYAAILGKALLSGAIDLARAIREGNGA